MAAALLEHVRQAAPPARQRADRPVRRQAAEDRGRRDAARGRPTRPPTFARPDVRVHPPVQRCRARPARADLRPLSPVGTPRLRLLAAGRFADKWLAPRARSPSGRSPAERSSSCSRCRRHAGHPDRPHRQGNQADGPRTSRATDSVQLPRSRGGVWTLHFSSARPGYLGERAVSVRATAVVPLRARRSP